MASRPRPALRALADRVGIIPEYLDQSGTQTRVTSDETRVDLLAALGFDAATEEAARRALDGLERRERERLLPPAHVVPAGDAALEVRVRVPAGWQGDIGWALTLIIGEERVERTGRDRLDSSGTLALRLPVDPGVGYHQVHVRLHRGHEHPEDLSQWIVVPPRCPSPDSLLGGRRVFGIAANLYTLRSKRNWGVGDFGDLAELLRWSGEIGADFVGVNPLHALRNRGGDISPYSPVSRLFQNPLYLDVEAIPELAESSEARALLDAPEYRAKLASLRDASHVSYEEAIALKLGVLACLHRTFAEGHRGGDMARGRPYRRWVAEQGEALESFATFMALEAWLGEAGDDASAGGPPPTSIIRPPSPKRDIESMPAEASRFSWRDWPVEYQNPKSPAVARFRAEHAESVDFHHWLQFELDRQLENAASLARESGLALGVYQDLALGSDSGGSDAWAYQDILATGASIGAPADQYSAKGQNWGLPPLNPVRLAETGYAYWIALLRSAFRHAGGIRIDHILGLFRQFWIPEGKEGKDGAYVRFPTEDMLGILALEAARAAALVVGEDLGTVPPEVPPTLARWGILSSKVLYFERDRLGFHPAASYDPHSLTSANTHDMATIDGFWSGRDVELKLDAGLIDASEANSARADRAHERRELLDRLEKEGIIAEGVEPNSRAELRGAVHDFLCRTPAALVALSLDDLVGEEDPVNLPGVGADKYPSWSRRMRLTIEALRTDPGVRRSLGRCAALRGRIDTP
ncbi:MAG: 4-alpha-glucanotransferase [Gemmatimonadota bacterium]|nr:4-alpha-glucanotransferase [Gemmatimonadota bacterium]